MYYNSYKNPFISQNNNSSYFGIHNEMENILNTIFHGKINKTETEEKKDLWFKPKIDIFETNSHYIVTTELAGVLQSDINLSIEKNTLTISGEKKAIDQDKETTIFRQERNFGKFNRSIEFPERANPELTKAEFKEGVLTVKIEKYTSSEPKKIEIHTT